ncbi:hypothetical protein ATANTOWER_028793 [Ataeniobius toweri]|uniref:Uncharacterized protein n=1 Tax=Ataeniobius toweri TaxID=208326 RepID=A0ABU7B061_9TELE|nr:hypothetical protein [Ataeniobius toweri]
MADVQLQNPDTTLRPHSPKHFLVGACLLSPEQAAPSALQECKLPSNHRFCSTICVTFGEKVGAHKKGGVTCRQHLGLTAADSYSCIHRFVLRQNTYHKKQFVGRC